MLTKLVKRFFISAYLISRILIGTLINANFGHSTFIYLALINVACKLSKRLFILKWEHEPRLCRNVNKCKYK